MPRFLIPSLSSRIHGQDAPTPAARREEERQRDRERGRDRSAATCAPLGLPSRALRALVAVLHDRGAFTASTRQGRLHAAKSSASETGSTPRREVTCSRSPRYLRPSN